MADIKGIIVPIVTPMNEDESINLDELRVQIDRQIDAGIDGIFPFGTNGEAYVHCKITSVASHHFYHRAALVRLHGIT